MSDHRDLREEMMDCYQFGTVTVQETLSDAPDVVREPYWLDEVLHKNGPCPACGRLGGVGIIESREHLLRKPTPIKD